MRVVFLGPPGSGKGTQASFLEAKYGACLVATGDILRKAVREQTPLGKKAREYVEKGELVPDDIMITLVTARLCEADCRKGFILDGFPRTVVQAGGLEAMLTKIGSSIDRVLCFRVPREVVFQRLGGRRTCKQCGYLYHLIFNPPKRKGLCDRCDGELFQREDDREETIAARLRVYEKQTTPLIDYYRRRGLLREIDGLGRVEEIRTRVLEALGQVTT